MQKRAKEQGALTESVQLLESLKDRAEESYNNTSK